MTARLKSLLAIALIGDGVVAALTPRRHLRRWESGPSAWQAVVRPFRRRPRLTRALGAAQAAAAAAWVFRIAPRRA